MKSLHGNQPTTPGVTLTLPGGSTVGPSMRGAWLGRSPPSPWSHMARSSTPRSPGGRCRSAHRRWTTIDVPNVPSIITGAGSEKAGSDPARRAVHHALHHAWHRLLLTSAIRADAGATLRCSVRAAVGRWWVCCVARCCAATVCARLLDRIQPIDSRTLLRALVLGRVQLYQVSSPQPKI